MLEGCEMGQIAVDIFYNGCVLCAFRQNIRLTLNGNTNAS